MVENGTVSLVSLKYIYIYIYIRLEIKSFNVSFFFF